MHASVRDGYSVRVVRADATHRQTRWLAVANALLSVLELTVSDSHKVRDLYVLQQRCEALAQLFGAGHQASTVPQWYCPVERSGWCSRDQQAPCRGPPVRRIPAG